MNLFFQLFQNIYTRLILLNQDFITPIPDINVIQSFLINLFTALIIILFCFSIGKKILILVKFDFTKKYSYLLSIAIGYILFSYGIALLGFFSKLNSYFIIIYFILIIMFIRFPLNAIKDLKNLSSSIKNSIMYIKINKTVFIFTFLFVLIAFVNLINPETREDQYHVDYARIYLEKHTILIPPKEDISVSASPMLSEMFYITAIFISNKEVTRILHFLFYLSIIFCLIEFSRLNKYKFALYTPLLFTSAPEIIHETSSAYTDFQWIFCLLLSFLILVDYKKNKSGYAISGFLFGGMLSTKLWTIVISATMFLYMMIEKNTIKKIFIFFIATALISSFWFLRSYILTESFFYPGFIKSQKIVDPEFIKRLSIYFGFNDLLINPLKLINIFSPLFFIGIAALVLKIKKNFKYIFSNKVNKFALLMLIMYFIINYQFGRYLFGLYIFIIFTSSLGLYQLSKNKIIKFVISFIMTIMFLYYATSYILVLPYTFGIANKNAYLSRIFIKDNSSYYDFENKFEKYISNNDLVAMVNFHGYYYADFKYIDVNYILNKEKNTFQQIRKNNITKLLLRGGDIIWFCRKYQISDCSEINFIEISKYIKFPYYYLYQIKQYD